MTKGIDPRKDIKLIDGEFENVIDNSDAAGKLISLFKSVAFGAKKLTELDAEMRSNLGWASIVLSSIMIPAYFLSLVNEIAFKDIDKSADNAVYADKYTKSVKIAAALGGIGLGVLGILLSTAVVTISTPLLIGIGVIRSVIENSTLIGISLFQHFHKNGDRAREQAEIEKLERALMKSDLAINTKAVEQLKNLYNRSQKRERDVMRKMHGIAQSAIAGVAVALIAAGPTAPIGVGILVGLTIYGTLDFFGYNPFIMAAKAINKIPSIFRSIKSFISDPGSKINAAQNKLKNSFNDHKHLEEKFLEKVKALKETNSLDKHPKIKTLNDRRNRLINSKLEEMKNKTVVLSLSELEKIEAIVNPNSTKAKNHQAFLEKQFVLKANELKLGTDISKIDRHKLSYNELIQLKKAEFERSKLTPEALEKLNNAYIARNNLYAEKYKNNHLAEIAKKPILDKAELVAIKTDIMEKTNNKKDKPTAFNNIKTVINTLEKKDLKSIDEYLRCHDSKKRDTLASKLPASIKEDVSIFKADDASSTIIPLKLFDSFNETDIMRKLLLDKVNQKIRHLESGAKNNSKQTTTATIAQAVKADLRRTSDNMTYRQSAPAVIYPATNSGSQLFANRTNATTRETKEAKETQETKNLNFTKYANSF